MCVTSFINQECKQRFNSAPILVLIGWMAAILPAHSAAGAFAPGSILVANGSRITEYAANGDPARVIDIQPREGQTSVLARDVVVDRYGRIQVMTFSPGAFMASEQAYLSTYDPAAGTWQHNTIEGWSLASVTYYGGLRSMTTTFTRPICRPGAANETASFDFHWTISLRRSDFTRSTVPATTYGTVSPRDWTAICTPWSGDRPWASCSGSTR